MTLIQKMGSEHANDFLIKLSDFAKYLKPIAHPAHTANNFQRPTKSCTKKEAYVI